MCVCVCPVDGFVSQQLLSVCKQLPSLHWWSGSAIVCAFFFFFYFVFPLQSAEFLGSHFTENVFGHSGWFSVPVEATSLHCCATDSSPQKRFTQNLLPRIPSLKLASHGTADTWCYIKKMCWFSLKISKSENQCKMFPLCIFSNFLIPKVSKK